MKSISLTKTITILNKTKKTGAKFWKDVREGDVLELEFVMKESRYARGGAPTINVYENKRLVHEDYSSRITDNLKNFEIQEEN